VWDSTAFTAWINGFDNSNGNSYSVDPGFGRITYGFVPDVLPAGNVSTTVLVTDGQQSDYIGAVDPDSVENWTTADWTT